VTDLAAKSCVPCQGGVPPLAEDLQQQLLAQLNQDGAAWDVVDGHHLERTFEFPNFKDALAFTNRVGEIAEAEAHHPDLYLAWGKLRVTIWTHKIDGLTESDFVLAAKIERAHD
jgi:4a-hydroxytetrahydrobiopterin dehydratase